MTSKQDPLPKAYSPKSATSYFDTSKGGFHWLGKKYKSLVSGGDSGGSGGGGGGSSKDGSRSGGGGDNGGGAGQSPYSSQAFCKF